MEVLGDYVFKKEVDKSLLTEGFSIPLEFQVIFKRNIGKFLQRGESKEIALYLNGKSYKAQIKNQKFDDFKYKHKDIVQIRYNRNSNIDDEFKKVFYSSYRFITEQRLQKKLLNGNREDKIYINIPDERKEYLIIYTTEYEDTYILDTITVTDILKIKELTKDLPEKVYEESFNYDDVVDDNASIALENQLVKVRKYNNSIGKNLKELYEYRCQICGIRVGEKYDSNIVEAHHIDSFVKSLNNNMNNIMILCPNHHNIIHDVNPYFNKKSNIFVFENGYKESLQLNYHL